jgi:hypothetical protein
VEQLQHSRPAVKKIQATHGTHDAAAVRALSFSCKSPSEQTWRRTVSCFTLLCRSTEQSVALGERKAVIGREPASDALLTGEPIGVGMLLAGSACEALRGPQLPKGRLVKTFVLQIRSVQTFM